MSSRPDETRVPFGVEPSPVADGDEPAEAPSQPPEGEPEPEPVEAEAEGPEHAPGELRIPAGYRVVEGEPDGGRRGVAVVVARFNAEITSRLLESALAELEEIGVPQDAVTVVPVPGAFELPLAAMAFAKTRRFACVIALGCVIRGETPHFDYVAGEAASGLQLAGLETGVPVSFGVLTTETAEQAEARVDKGAEAVRSALEMADLFAQLRAAARPAATG
jgi:6,7-dimethyl-8-ribityllumazine synthase